MAGFDKIAGNIQPESRRFISNTKEHVFDIGGLYCNFCELYHYTKVSLAGMMISRFYIDDFVVF